MRAAADGRTLLTLKARCCALLAAPVVSSISHYRTMPKLAPNSATRAHIALIAVAALGLCAADEARAQGEFHQYPSFEGAAADAPLPSDWDVPGELVIGRLMYPNAGNRGFFGGDWRRGGTSWTDDYPRGDRTLVQMIRRFTRTNVRAVEQPINLELEAGPTCRTRRPRPVA